MMIMIYIKNHLATSSIFKHRTNSLFDGNEATAHVFAFRGQGYHRLPFRGAVRHRSSTRYGASSSGLGQGASFLCHFGLGPNAFETQWLFKKARRSYWLATMVKPWDAALR